jgi:hypothetical protein
LKVVKAKVVDFFSILIWIHKKDIYECGRH